MLVHDDGIGERKSGGGSDARWTETRHCGEGSDADSIGLEEHPVPVCGLDDGPDLAEG